jgi:hypothetical protein
VKTADPKLLVQNIRAAVKQDPHKAGMLGFLGLVLLVLAGRLLLSDAAPHTASGATITTSGNATASLAIYAASAAQRGSGRSESQDSAGAERPHNSQQRLRDWLAEATEPVGRNLFSVRLDYFPQDGSRPAEGVKTAADGEFWGRLEKSLKLQTDQRTKREVLLTNFRDEAAKLQLDSIVMGPNPQAMIDGKLVTEGDVVASAFRVLKIEPRRIIVEREGIKLEIQMK